MMNNFELNEAELEQVTGGTLVSREPIDPFIPFFNIPGEIIRPTAPIPRPVGPIPNPIGPFAPNRPVLYNALA